MRVAAAIALAIIVLAGMQLFLATPAQACYWAGKNTGNCKATDPPSRPRPPGGGSGGGSGGGGSDDGSWTDDDGRVYPPCPWEVYKHLCRIDWNDPKRPAPPTEIPESEFQTFDIPVPEIHAWPADWAVIGKPAAFWTTAKTSYIDMTLLTYAVTVKVTPEEYHWDFGDGTGTTTTTKGAKPRPGDTPIIGHDFEKVGPTTVSMTTSFSGEFSVDGGPWLPIDGRAYVDSNDLPIDVYRFHRYLVDEDCIANPRGPDCN